MNPLEKLMIFFLQLKVLLIYLLSFAGHTACGFVFLFCFCLYIDKVEKI